MSNINNTTLIGVDFSINKPAITIFSNNKYYFYGWPYSLKEEYKKLFIDNNIILIDRTDNKEKGNNSSEKIRYEIFNSNYLATLIFNSIKNFLNYKTYIAFEGLSYGSSGDVYAQLSGYKYVLMNKLSELVPLKNMFTYSPQTIKKTAGCSGKGKNKKDMIEAFINSEHNLAFQIALKEKRDFFMKKGNKNWIEFVDDIVDSFFTLETLRDKENV